MSNLNEAQFKEYTKHYNAGWRHASTKNASYDNNPHPYVPGAENAANEAWDDGYTDNGVGRSKYALRGHRFGTGPSVEGY